MVTEIADKNDETCTEPQEATRREANFYNIQCGLYERVEIPSQKPCRLSEYPALLWESQDENIAIEMFSNGVNDIAVHELYIRLYQDCWAAVLAIINMY